MFIKQTLKVSMAWGSFLKQNIWPGIIDAFQGAIAGYIYRQGTLMVYIIPSVRGSLPCT